MDIDGIIFYLKCQYSTDNRNQITLTKNFTSIEKVPSFEKIFQELKIISKSMNEDENTNLRNKALFGGWISVARMTYRHDKLIKRKSLPQLFDDWMRKQLGIKKPKIYDYINLYELMSVAPNC